MQVTINNTIYEYESDYSKISLDWKVKLKDAFRTAIIGNTNCFIKRFRDKPNAHELMIALKNKVVVNMPCIYDLVTVVENKETVYYLFTEFIEGKTLKESINKGEFFDIKKIVSDILESLKFIHSHGFWFSDLNEENVFCNVNGSYLLIDVDSCWPNNIRPNADITLAGGMPGASQKYANVAMQFYREILGMPNFLYEDIEGKNLNSLQLLAISAKLAMFSEFRKNDPATLYFNEKRYTNLHVFLLNKNDIYCKNIFKRALANELKYEMVTEFSKFIIGEYELHVSNLPVIERFMATETEAYKGGKTTLLWKVRNADKIVVIGANNQVLVDNAKSTSTYEVTVTETSTYVITAVKAGKSVSTSVQINVTTLAKPDIAFFRSAKTRVKKGEAVTLTWSVNNAIKIYINGKEHNINNNSCVIQQDKSTTYKLLAINKAGAEETKSIEVKMKSPVYWIASAIVITLTIFFIFIWQSNLSSKYDSNVEAAESASSNGDYDEALDLYNEANKIKESLFVFSKSSLGNNISNVKAKKYTKEGEDFLRTGKIIPLELINSGCALNSFRQAQLFNETDETINKRINFCEMILTARKNMVDENWNLAETNYNKAIEYGKNTHVPGECLKIVKEILERYVLAPRVKFTDTKVEHNYFSKDFSIDYGKKGMLISFTFEVANLKDSTCYLIVKFFHKNGAAIKGNESDYTWDLNNEQLGFLKKLDPPLYKNTKYSNVAVFMPYEKFSSLGSGKSELYFNAAVFFGGQQIGEATKNITFTITKP